MSLGRAILHLLAILGAIGAYLILCSCSSIFGPLVWPEEDWGPSGVGVLRVGLAISTPIFVAAASIYLIRVRKRKTKED